MAAEETARCDVLVIGSGAGGMAAAITARHHGLDVITVEKDAYFGGTTARSGGWLWVPCNDPAIKSGVKDSIDAARTYLQNEAGNHFDPRRVDTFLAMGPRMVEFFERNTAVRFFSSPSLPDYHNDVPGSAAGRAICAEPFDARALGEDIAKLRPVLREMTFLGMAVSSGTELHHFKNATRSLASAAFVARRLAYHAIDLAKHGRSMRLTNGNALSGRLMKSAKDLNIPVWLSAPAKELIVVDGAVRGARVEREGKPVRIEARRAVVLACGGFPEDPARCRTLFPFSQQSEYWTLASPGNTGDGLRMAEAAGAMVEETLPNAAAWVPVSRVPWPDGSTGTYAHVIDRAQPGIIAVTEDGRRFTNEGASYHDFVVDMTTACQGRPKVEAFLVCDHRTLRRYGMGFVKPFPVPFASQIRSGYLLKGETLKALAERAGIDAATFEATVEAYNVHAREGRDPAFGKGATVYSRFMGDPAATLNPCVAPVQDPPFYAIKVVPGVLGTYAGLKTDEYARVLGKDSQPIAGLYAAGNDLGSIMGGTYTGPGTTLGPAMTFGFIAGRHAAGVA